MKGIIFYTNNVCEERIALACQHLLSKAGLPIVSVSQYPMNFGSNTVVPFKSGKLSMFKQILIALEKSKADTIFCCEHDVLYHKSHFEFTLPSSSRYYFNTNFWTLDACTGKALWYNDIGIQGRRMTCGLVADRQLLINHFKRKIQLASEEGFSHSRHGYAPGKPAIDNVPYDIFLSTCPNIDIKHDKNITKGRFDLSLYKRRNKIRNSWTLTTSIPCWGKTSPFDNFLRSIYASDTKRAVQNRHSY